MEDISHMFPTRYKNPRKTSCRRKVASISHLTRYSQTKIDPARHNCPRKEELAKFGKMSTALPPCICTCFAQTVGNRGKLMGRPHGKINLAHIGHVIQQFFQDSVRR